MTEPDYAIHGQRHLERHPGGGDPDLKFDRWHVIDRNALGGEELSICKRLVDPTCSMPLDRWETLGVDRCDKTWDPKCNCVDIAGGGPAEQAKRERRDPDEWTYQ
jgi:hypothetical protein